LALLKNERLSLKLVLEELLLQLELLLELLE
jgi:hypothetical protein